jgi:hypothetical protein
MKNSRTVFILVVILFACCLFVGTSNSARCQETGKPYPVETKSVEGIKTVLNPDYPRDGVVSPKYVEVWSVGGETDPQGELINRPQDIRAAADGSVYVLDWKDVCVRVFDAAGKFVRAIGRSGQGPGEINLPCWIDLGPGGELFILDGMNMRISRFGKDGTFIKSFRMEKFASLVRIDGLGRVYRGEESTSESSGLSSEYKEIVRSLTIVRTDADGGNPKRFGPFIGEKILQKGDGKSVITLSSRVAPTTGWAVNRDGRVCAGHNEKYEIGVYDRDGTLLFRFGRKYKPVKNPLSRSSVARTPAARSQPEYLPAFNPDLFFDDEGNIWIPLFRGGDKEPFVHDVFSPDGIYLRQVVTPFRIYRVRGDNAYSIVETEEGFRVIKCFRLELPAA